MGNIFSAPEVVEMGIQIEKNGRDFYSGAIALIKSDKPKDIFTYLAGEEEKHIMTFEAMLLDVKKYEPSEAYPGEYFAYLKALAKGYVFTKEGKGKEIAKNVKSQDNAIELGIGFEKDSILFYQGMKQIVLEDEHEVIQKLIEQEQKHLLKLYELRG